LKKFIVTIISALLTIAVLCGSLIGCGTTGGGDSSTSSEAPAYEQVADKNTSQTHSDESTDTTSNSSRSGAAGAIAGSTSGYATTNATRKASPTQQDDEPDRPITAALPVIDKNTTATLTITGLDLGNSLDGIIRQFNGIFPNVAVVKDDVQYTGDRSNSRHVNDMQQTTLSTKILSGQAGDVIQPGYNNSAKFIRQNAFADLHEFIYGDPEFNTGDYFMSVIEALSFNGRLYTMPLGNVVKMLGFYKPLVGDYSFTDSSGVWEMTRAIEEAKNLIDQNSLKDKNYIFGMFEDYMLFRWLLSENYAQFFDLETGRVNIGSAEFIDMLEYIKGLADAGYIPSSERDDNTLSDFPPVISLYSSEGELSRYMINKDDLAEMRPEVGKKGELMITDGFGNTSLSINEHSPNKRLAWEFIKCALSYEAQSSPDVFYPPINRAALHVYAEQRYIMLKNSMLEWHKEAAEKDDYFTDQAEAIRQWEELVVNLNDNVTKYTFHDGEIDDIIYEQVNEFLKGKISAEETAKILQRKISMAMEG